jgi:hypothetical protein
MVLMCVAPCIFVYDYNYLHKQMHYYLLLILLLLMLFIIIINNSAFVGVDNYNYFMVFRYSRKIPQRNSPTNFTGRILLGKPVASRLINSPHFMGSEVLSSHSKRPATLQCPEPHKFCPRTHTILQIYFNIFYLLLVHPSGLFPAGFVAITCVHLDFPCTCYVPFAYHFRFENPNNICEV